MSFEAGSHRCQAINRTQHKACTNIRTERAFEDLKLTLSARSRHAPASA